MGMELNVNKYQHFSDSSDGNLFMLGYDQAIFHKHLKQQQIHRTDLFKILNYILIFWLLNVYK